MFWFEAEYILERGDSQVGKIWQLKGCLIEAMGYGRMMVRSRLCLSLARKVSDDGSDEISEGGPPTDGR